MSQSPKHDLQEGNKLINSLGSRILGKIQRIYGDKAYTSRKFSKKLREDYDIQMIVELKTNAIDYGTSSPPDKSVRLYQKSSKL